MVVPCKKKKKMDFESIAFQNVFYKFEKILSYSILLIFHSWMSERIISRIVIRKKDKEKERKRERKKKVSSELIRREAKVYTLLWKFKGKLGLKKIVENWLSYRMQVLNRLIALTPWLMEPADSVPHSQGPSNNPYPEPNEPISLTSILTLSSHLRLSLPKGLFPVGLPVKKNPNLS